MRLYISCSFADRARAQRIAGAIGEWGSGITVTSSWLFEPPFKHDDADVEAWQKRARGNEDLLDIERSTAMLLLTATPSTSGGFYTELGIALARRIPIYIIGPKIGVFMYSNQVEPTPGWILDAVEEADNAA